MELLEEYKNILEKIKEYLISEFKKRYDDIEVDDDMGFLLRFTIKGRYRFELDLESRYFHISCDTELGMLGRYVETFKELFEFINEIIKEEAEYEMRSL